MMIIMIVIIIITIIKIIIIIAIIIVIKVMMIIKIEINIISMDNFDMSNDDNCYFHQYPHYHYNR